MFLPTFLSLSVLALLQLGATQEFVILTRNQLREEIQAGITAALSSGNQSHSILNLLRNDLCTCDRLNATLQEAVKRLSTAVERQSIQQTTASTLCGHNVERVTATAVNNILVNVSDSVEQLVSPLMTQLHLLRVPGSTPSHPATSCREMKELSPTAPSDYYWLRGTGDSSHHMYCDTSRITHP